MTAKQRSHSSSRQLGEIFFDDGRIVGGVVDQPVDAAEAFERLRGHRLGREAVADIDLDGERGSAGGVDLGGHFAGRVEIGGDDAVAGFGQRLGVDAADAAGRAGDDHDLHLLPRPQATCSSAKPRAKKAGSRTRGSAARRAAPAGA